MKWVSSDQKILAIETSGKTLSVALAESVEGKFKIKSELFFDVGLRHSEMLKPVCEEMLSQCGCALQQLSAIAVCTGPGSFTGIRVGVSFARALAQSLKIPLVGVAVFDILARGASGQKNPVAVVIESIGQDVFSAIYDGGCQVKVSSLQQFLDGLNPKKSWTILGSGSVKYEKEIAHHLKKNFCAQPEQVQVPSARFLSQIAFEKIVRSGANAFSWKKVTPFYLRHPIASERAGYRNHNWGQGQGQGQRQSQRHPPDSPLNKGGF